MTTPDAELLRRYVENRAEDAFTELVDRHLKLVYFAAWRRTADPHLAEDVAQYVFTALARDAASLSHHAVLTGWLYSTTRFAAAKVLRSERRRRVREQEAYMMQESSSSITSQSPASVADGQEMRPFVDAALDELGERDRAALLLRFFEGRAFAEIGAVLRVTEDAARMRVERALEKLRAVLARRGVTSTAAALGITLASQAGAVGSLPAGLAASVTGSALATAASLGGGGTLAVFMGFMTTTKWIVTVAGVALLVATFGAAVDGAGSRATAEDAHRSAERSFAALVSNRRDLEARVHAAEQSVGKLQQALDDATAADARVAAQRTKIADTPVEPAAPAWDPVAEGKAFVARHAPLKPAFVARADAMNRFNYGPLIRELGLTPAQTEEFLELLREGSGMSGAFGPYGKSLFIAAGDGWREGDFGERLRALLGWDGAKKFSDFYGVQLARTTAVQLASALLFTDTPLTSDQASRVTQIMTETQPPSRQGQPRELDWAAIEARASSVLSPAQLVALGGLRAQSAKQERINPPTSAPKK
jgi:RNA polymerase sigma factor (sigma-70 family)